MCLSPFSLCHFVGQTQYLIHVDSETLQLIKLLYYKTPVLILTEIQGKCKTIVTWYKIIHTLVKGGTVSSTYSRLQRGQ